MRTLQTCVTTTLLLPPFLLTQVVVVVVVVVLVVHVVHINAFVKVKVGTRRVMGCGALKEVEGGIQAAAAVKAASNLALNNRLLHNQHKHPFLLRLLLPHLLLLPLPLPLLVGGVGVLVIAMNACTCRVTRTAVMGTSVL